MVPSFLFYYRIYTKYESGCGILFEELERRRESIYHNKTREYYDEVISSFENENYRSSVVMLYTVTICDIFFKLKDLAEVHNDEKVQKILSELENEKDENPVSSDWENKLIEKAFYEAKILENDVYTHINTLKKYRNLSAHPVLNSLEILYKPNKELVYSLIVNISDNLLSKHPLFTKNIFIPFILEIERIKNEFSNQNALETYLDSKYFKYFSLETVEYIFKQLWKFVYKSLNERERSNRKINYKVLLILYNKYESHLEDYIKNQISYFSDFVDDDLDVLQLFVDFLINKPNVYKLLNIHTKQLLDKRIKSKSKMVVVCYFLHDSVEDHLSYLDDYLHCYGEFINQPYQHNHLLSIEEIKVLYEISKENDVLTSFYDLMISHYYHSGHFNTSEHTFVYCILPYFNSFNAEQMKTLLTQANSNPQCYKAKYSKFNHQKLLPKAKELLSENIEKEYSMLF